MEDLLVEKEKDKRKTKEEDKGTGTGTGGPLKITLAEHSPTGLVQVGTNSRIYMTPLDYSR